MKEKIKIFTRGSEDSFIDLEAEINEWLEERTVTILARTVSTSCGINIEGKPFVNCTVCIFYQNLQ